jgi:hypothetical protein
MKKIVVCFCLLSSITGNLFSQKLGTFFAVQCWRLENKVEENAIEHTIRTSIGWAKNKDLALLYSVIVNDSTYFEIDPDSSMIDGFEQFKENERFWMNPNFKAIRYEIRDLRITLSKSGDAAWFFCMLDDINEWKGKPASWINTRWTGVLEKRNGKWVIVQMHFSFPVGR